jgi:hypothetical protein
MFVSTLSPLLFNGDWASLRELCFLGITSQPHFNQALTLPSHGGFGRTDA